MLIALAAQLLPVCLLLGFFRAATSWFCHNEKEAVLFFCRTGRSDPAATLSYLMLTTKTQKQSPQHNIQSDAPVIISAFNLLLALFYPLDCRELINTK